MSLLLVILAIVVSQLDAFCLKQGCDKYFEKVKTDAKVTGACAVLFEENCCKSVGTFGDAKKLFVVPRGGKGKLCGTSKTLLNAAASVIGAGTSSSCTGPDLKDNVKSLIVMPGCTLEVWDKDSNPERKGSLWYAEEEEKKSANAGNLRDAIDRYDRNKLSITATGTPNWIEELEDDFEDMEEDIETYRCTCK